MMKPEDWTPAGGLVLEPNALRSVISVEGCQLVPAGPGAGKTELLAQRADFLLRSGVCPFPYRILAISFKVEASSNLASRVSERCRSELASRFDSYTFHAFALGIIRRFRQHLPEEDSLDRDFELDTYRDGNSRISFDDLLPMAISILRGSEIARNAIRATYTDVFLDEFQDCTPAQYDLIKMCFQGANKRLIAVGDNKQLIMEFADASVQTFGKYKTDFEARENPIYFNYRSEPRLLRLQNEVIQTLDPQATVSKEHLSQLEGEMGVLRRVRFENTESEAKFLADLITEWVEVEGVPLSEIAVLVRQQVSLNAQALFDELKARNIPFKDEHASQDLTSEPVCRLIVDYLLVLHGDREPEAYERLSLMFERISSVSRDAENIMQRLSNHLQNDFRIVKMGSDTKATPKSLVGRLLKLVGRRTLISLSPSYESTSYLKDSISRIIKDLDQGLKDGRSVHEVLLSLTNDQAVRVFTIHKCKGLEFHSVILLGVEKELFWSSSLDNNRREFFVAVSRAKERLYMTSAVFREKPQGANHHWKTTRHGYQEFFDYAEPHLSPEGLSDISQMKD